MTTISGTTRALLVGAALALALTAPRADAQIPASHPPLGGAPGSAQGESPSFETGDGTIQGQLVHREGEALEAGQQIVLYALSSSGDLGVRRTTTDADGRFEFDGVPSNSNYVYLVSVRVGDIPYGERLAFEPGESVHALEIQILSTTLQDDAIAAGAARVRLQQGCTHLHVSHSHTLRNDSQRVAYVPPDQRGGREPFLQVDVGPEAQNLVGPTGMELEVEGGIARFWGPLYPGEASVDFSYGLPDRGETTSLRLRSNRGTPLLELEVPSALGVPRHESLTLQEETSAYIRLRGPELAAGEDFRWRQPTGGRAGTAAVGTPAAQLWLDIDDAVLDVRESHQLAVPMALPESGFPLLCIQLPQDVRNPRFSGDALRWGLTPEPSGMLVLHGPLPAGSPVIAFQYDLPVRTEPVRFERSFGSGLDRLEVVVADTGIAPRTERLHPLRPLHNAGRNYLRLEGFAIEPGETIAMEFPRLENSGHAVGNMAAVATGVGALAAVGFLMAPLFTGHRREEEPPEISAARTERESIYRALDDLDEDLETGKIAAEDHEQMRSELRARAVSLLREEREPHRALPVATRCPGCGHDVAESDRFCSQCGQTLANASPSPTTDP